MTARKRSHGDGALLAIALFKFVKGAVILALACGAMSLFHKDVVAHVIGATSYGSILITV